MAVRNCLDCTQPLAAAALVIPSHGDSLVRCASCGAVYTSQLLITIPPGEWQRMLNRTGWTVARAGDVLQITEV